MVTFNHPRREEIELYAIGAREDVAFPDIETHFASCDDCAAELRKEARLELAIAEVATVLERCPSCSTVIEGSLCARCGACVQAGGYHMERLVSVEDQIRTYVARSPSGTKVMIKELAFKTTPSILTVAAFEKEAQLLRQLDHRAIPRYRASFEAGRDENKRLYLVHDFVEGERLVDLLEHHRFSEREIISIAHQVLEALVYLHNLAPPIFHRDLRPANLMRGPDGKIVLISFGSARDFSVTSLGTIVGLVGYVPPAQLVGLVDETSDLYALGATLIHLLTRRPPWQDEQLGETLRRVRLYPQIRQFLEKLVAPDAASRFPNARAAYDALMRIVWAPRMHHDRRPSRRTSALLGALAGVFATVVAFAMIPQRTTTTARPPPVQPPSPRTGMLIIESEPQGAIVELDGKTMSFGRGGLAMTPADITDLGFGMTYRIALSKPGYQRFETEVRVDRESDRRTIFVVLNPLEKPLPETGRVRFESRPPGASITVDGVPLWDSFGRPQLTPTEVDGFEYGEHKVKIELDGYKTRDVVMHVGGEQTKIFTKLEPSYGPP